MRRVRSRTLAIVVVVLTALAGVSALMLYQRQHALLDRALISRGNYLFWYALQCERESLRLLREMDQMLSSFPSPSQVPASMRQRYELMVSAFQLVLDAPDTPTLREDAREQLSPAQLSKMAAYVSHADLFFARTDVPNLRDLRMLRDELDELRPSLHAMVYTLYHAGGERLDEAALRLDELNRYGVALTAATMASLVLLGLLAARHLRQNDARRQLEAMAKDLQEARRVSETANVAKSAFIANVSHELRTPFQGMLGMMSLLAETPLTPLQNDYLRTAADSARHVMQLLNDVLDISKIESGTLRIHAQPTALLEAFSEVESVMLPLAIERRLALVFRVPSDLPPWVEVDAMRLKQILFNLLSNALKFTPQGRVSVSAHWLPSLDDRRGQLSVEVADTGTGIPKEEIPKLFTRFHQQAVGVPRAGGGNGLGLEISRSLARMMGGDIGVTSEWSKGSTFRLTLELRPCAPPPPRPVAAPAEGRYAGMRALVAEDHPVNRKYMDAVLTRLGFQVTLCENGVKALRAAAHGHFDVVFMDMHMPVMDGLAATKAIRSMGGRHAKLRILALTGDTSEALRQRLLEVRIDGILAKPAGQDELVAALDALPGLSGAARRPPEGAAVKAAPSSWSDTVEIRSAAQAGVVNGSTLQGLAKTFSPAQFLELVDTLFRDDSGLLAQIDATVAQRDLTGVRRHAHALKGAAEVLGLAAVARAARDLMDEELEPHRVLDELHKTMETSQAVVHAMLVDWMEEEEA